MKILMHHAMLLGLEGRIDFLLSGASSGMRILEKEFPQIYTPDGHKIEDIDDGCIMLVHSGTVGKEGIKEKFATIADSNFTDRNKPGTIHDNVIRDQNSFILYIIDGNQEVLCGCNLMHGTFLEEPNEEYFYIYDLCTEKTHHRQGLAKALLKGLRKFTKSTGVIKWLWLTVDTRKNNGVPAKTLVEIYEEYEYEKFTGSLFDNNDHLIPMRRRASAGGDG